MDASADGKRERQEMRETIEATNDSSRGKTKGDRHINLPQDFRPFVYFFPLDFPAPALVS